MYSVHSTGTWEIYAPRTTNSRVRDVIQGHQDFPAIIVGRIWVRASWAIRPVKLRAWHSQVDLSGNPGQQFAIANLESFWTQKHQKHRCIGHVSISTFKSWPVCRATQKYPLIIRIIRITYEDSMTSIQRRLVWFSKLKENPKHHRAVNGSRLPLDRFESYFHLRK